MMMILIAELSVALLAIRPRPSRRGTLAKESNRDLHEIAMGSNRMLKKAASFVLAALRGSTYRKEYAFAPSLAAAAPDGLFDHPAGWVLSENFAPIGT
jgi:hypothetical protein